ncbi:MAG: twin-arginine translocation signal domain-containing protein, partial [Bacteroidota bacterium]
MQRRNFLKLSGLGAGAAVTGGSLTGFLVSCSGCKKEHHRGLMTKPVMVTQGDFSRLLSFPPQAGANQTLTAQVTTANLRGI